MIINQYELAIELERGGEWICDVTVHSENDVQWYAIEVDPPIWVDGIRSDPFPMEMRYTDSGALFFKTEHALTDDLKELETMLAREIINEII